MAATSLGEALVPRARDRRRRRSHLRIAQAARPLSQKNRRIAIQIHGTTCAVCEFNFDETYSKDYAHGYIQIHHIKPGSQYEGEVDSETDLVPCAPTATPWPTGGEIP
jgi:predicted HNH restriction endonuclease